MNEVAIFENPEFGKVRTLQISGEPWFVGKDVVEILGYSNSRDTLSKRVDDEDKMDGVAICDSIGRKQTPVLINESGLYSLVLSSKLPTAKKFKRWITSEVLPIIRKTGGYVSNDDMFIETYLPFADDNTKMMFRTTLETVRKQNEIIQSQRQEIIHKEDVIVGLVDEISLADKRQILNRVVKYKHANYRERWSMLYREFENKYHMDLSRRFETYNETHKPKCKSKVEYIDKVLNKIPELYELAAKLFENDVKELVEEMYSIAS